MLFKNYIKDRKIRSAIFVLLIFFLVITLGLFFSKNRINKLKQTAQKEETTIEASYYVRETNENEINVTIYFESNVGIKEVIEPNGNELNVQVENKKKLAIDYKVTSGEEYVFKIKLSESNEFEDYTLYADINAKPQITQEGGVTTIKKVNIDYGQEGNNYYSWDNGETWIEYTEEIVVKEEGTILAKSKNKNNEISKIEKEEILIDYFVDLDAKTIAEKPQTYYGKTVIDYQAKNGWNGWQIFHSDGTNIYLTTNNYLTKEYVPYSVKNGEVTQNKPNVDGKYRFLFNPIMNDYTGASDITKNNPAYKWLDMYLDKYPTSDEEVPSMKAVSYLMDTTAWNEFTDNEDKAEYAIGAPTIQLYLESYNMGYPNSQFKTYVDYKYGYSFRSILTMPKYDDFNNLYHIEKYDIYRISGIWLASPSRDRKKALLTSGGEYSQALRCFGRCDYNGFASGALCRI